MNIKRHTLCSSTRTSNYKQQGAGCRAAEEELVATADERDALVPQLEEAKWRARQADKDKADLQGSLQQAQQV